MRLQDYIPRRVRSWFAEGLTGTALGDSSGLVDGERGWTPITGRAATRDLDPISHEAMIRVARYLHTSDPLGGWLVDKPVEMAIGASELGYSVDVDTELEPSMKGLKGEALAARLKEIVDTIRGYLDPWWEHPLFNLRDSADNLYTSFLVDGSLTLDIVDHNAVTGLPRLDLIDAKQISGEGVKPLEGRATIPGTVYVQVSGQAAGVPYAVVNVDPTTLRFLPAGGDDKRCFYFRDSRIPNSMRGFSLLLRPADWVDALNTFVWNGVDRAKLLNCLVYDVTMQNATEKDIKKRLDELAKAPLWNPNTHYVHNEKESMEVRTADLKAYETAAMSRSIKNYILGSQSLPESWYAEGGETNRATLSEQGDPTYRSLERHQKNARRIFGTLLAYAYDQVAARQSDIPQRVDERGRIVVWLQATLPAMAAKDATRLASSMAQLGSGLKQAVYDELLSMKTARRIFLSTVNQLSGIEVEPDEEETAIDDEEEGREAERAAKDAEKAAMGYALAMKGKAPKGAGGEDGQTGGTAAGDEGGEDEFGAGTGGAGRGTSRSPAAGQRPVGRVDGAPVRGNRS
jgi:hypothetical protein